MKLQICGAAQTVTGSCHLLILEDNYKILLDCGLYQGNEDALEDFNHQWFFNPADIDVLILSHAHIDHCGRIPKLVNDGFKGKIYCTSATRDLAAIMLLDSAHIQETDAEYESRKFKKTIKPLYTQIDAKNCLKYFRCVEYDNWFSVNENIKVLFSDAGHILGAASVTLKINENNNETVFGFSGDIGRYNRPILKDPAPMPELDYFICESTYGGKTHEETPESDEHFLKIIYDTCVSKRGKLIIPAFSVGRTQELLYRLDKLYTNGKLKNIPVYVDSPLAMNATDIFLIHPECFDEEIYEYMRKDENPFGWNNMHYVKDANQSKKLNVSDEACIIIAASGMANAGRVKHHLFHQLPNAQNTVLIVGYCAQGTLGQQLVDKPETVNIFHQEIKVRASIEVMSSMSAHADQPELLQFISNQNVNKLKKIFLVHGEPKKQEAYKSALLSKQYRSVEIPSLGEVFEL
ncbi:MAG TPA: MBL fold metallo-hydrolase [Chitinophagales bacterium]|nr:MBL fold metallo-hydrolase [Chitinophagales bacterium]